MNFPSPKGFRRRRLAAVCFADIVGFTGLCAKDEPLALRLVQVFQAAARRATEAHGGSVVKFTGDGVLAAFTSVNGAAAAAIQLQLRFSQVTRDWAQGPHRLRVGVHLGDVTLAADGDIYGDGVNRASRLQGMAEPGQILVSEDVFRQLRQRPEVHCTDVGVRIAKGIDEPIRVYHLEPGVSLARELLSAAITEPTRAKGRKRYAKPIAVGMAVGIMSFVTLGVWTGIGGRRPSLRPEPRATYSCPHEQPLIGGFARGGSRRGGDARTPDVRRSDSCRFPGGHGPDSHGRPRPESRNVHQRHPTDHGAELLELSR